MYADISDTTLQTANCHIIITDGHEVELSQTSYNLYVKFKKNFF